MKKKFVIILSLIIAAALALTACGSESAPPEEASATPAVTEEPAVPESPADFTADALSGYWLQDWRIGEALVYPGFVFYDDNTFIRFISNLDVRSCYGTWEFGGDSLTLTVVGYTIAGEDAVYGDAMGGSTMSGSEKIVKLGTPEVNTYPVAAVSEVEIKLGDEIHLWKFEEDEIHSSFSDGDDWAFGNRIDPNLTKQGYTDALASGTTEVVSEPPTPVNHGLEAAEITEDGIVLLNKTAGYTVTLPKSWEDYYYSDTKLQIGETIPVNYSTFYFMGESGIPAELFAICDAETIEQEGPLVGAILEEGVYPAELSEIDGVMYYWGLWYNKTSWIDRLAEEPTESWQYYYGEDYDPDRDADKLELIRKDREKLKEMQSEIEAVIATFKAAG